MEYVPQRRGALAPERIGRRFQRVARALLGRATGPPARRDEDDPVEELARLLREPHAPDEARGAIVSLAHRLSGAERVELWLPEEADHPPHRAACWPPARDASPDDRAPSPLVLLLRFDGRVRGTLRLYPPRGDQGWPDGMLGRLGAFATLAASASLGSPPLPAGEAIRDPQTGASSSTFLAAFLTHAVAQSRRRNEPLAMLCIGLDSWEEAGSGPPSRATVETAIRRTARALMSTLRTSDVVARLDERRFAVVLPGANLAAARALASTLREVIAEVGPAADLSVPWTASVGLAAIPDHAREPGRLLAAAREALARAQAMGRGQITTAPTPVNTGSSMFLQRVG
jgi:diguanylate cyclase (GGDEF)-like protein